MAKVGRNDPCPCGSGRKHKQCCLAADGGATDLLGFSRREYGDRLIRRARRVEPLLASTSRRACRAPSASSRWSPATGSTPACRCWAAGLPARRWPRGDGRDMVEALLADLARKPGPQDAALDPSILAEMRATLQAAIPAPSRTP